MNDEASESPLMTRLRKVDDLTLTGPKPQGLPRSEIKERLIAFMLTNERLSGTIAFGEGVDKGNAPDGVQHYDPVEELRRDDSKLDQILMLVEQDMNFREAALLEEAQQHQASNVLLFGAAAKIARDEQLSDALRELVVKHLVSPPNFPSQPKGKPKRNPHVDERKYFAVKFAMQHGLKPTRNDTSQHHSACDLVAEAALELWKMGHSPFATRYGYDNLKKIYLNESKLRKHQRG